MFRPDPTILLLLKRGAVRGWTTLRRERGWVTSLSALLGVVVLTQAFLLAWFGVQGVETLLRSQTDLRHPLVTRLATPIMNPLIVQCVDVTG